MAHKEGYFKKVVYSCVLSQFLHKLSSTLLNEHYQDQKDKLLISFSTLILSAHIMKQKRHFFAVNLGLVAKKSINMWPIHLSAYLFGQAYLQNVCFLLFIRQYHI